MIAKILKRKWTEKVTTPNLLGLQAQKTPKTLKAVEKYYQVIKKTKGHELVGNVDSIKLTLLFNAYSKEWGSYAQEYVEKAYDHCCDFIRQVVKVYMWDALTARLHATVLDPLLMERKDLAM